MFGTKVVRTALLVLLLSVAAHPAFAWWNADWPYRVRIEADNGPTGANVTAPIGRTQILLRLQQGNFNFATAKEKGEDIRIIAADDRTPLKFHTEYFDGLTDQVGYIWIDVPDLAPGVKTAFYLYWGNKSANDGGDPKATYDTDTVLVYHFADDNGLPRDSTGYGNNALTPGKRDDGMIGQGMQLDGKTPIQIPASPSLALTAGQNLTVSLWARTSAGTPDGVLYSVRDPQTQNALTFGADKGILYAQVDTPAGSARTSSGTPIPTDGWHHLAVIAGDGKLTVYVDGDPRGDVAVQLPAIAGPILLGGATAAPPAAAAPAIVSGPPAPGAPGVAAPAVAPPAAPQAAPAAGFTGIIDELQIAKVARPLGWLQVAVHSQGPQPNLLTLGQAEEASVFGNGYLGIIMKSVTPDAWVVIGILGVMAVMSWAVMIGKALYVNATAAANSRFRSVFRKAAARAQEQGYGFASIPKDRRTRLRKSSLLRLYDAATEELEERVKAGRLSDDGLLAAASLAAIRSGVDGELARENQRLNRLMVLLTIAIAGGPFLGLLGTVVGVMITFAAIAQAGDVNVNAIAPGVSAALLATVAGLAVAIPALFGYNYFVTRIRDVSVDMATFVDEMVTRMGEMPHAVPVTAPPTRLAAE